MPAAKIARNSPLCEHGDIGDFSKPLNDEFQGMVLRRPCDATEYQAVVDKVVHQLGGENELQFKAQVDWNRAEPSSDEKAIDEAADSILPWLKDLPVALQRALHRDAHLICKMVMDVMRAKERDAVIELKVEAFGLSICSKWHHDNYIGRALTAYCGAGTEFTTDENIDWADRCCTPAIDERKIQRIEAGDVIFMKGLQFPSRVKALTHRSPAPARAADGQVLHRLILKVDCTEPEIHWHLNSQGHTN